MPKPKRPERELTPQEAQEILEQRRSKDPVQQYRPVPTFALAMACTMLDICIQSVNQVGKSAFLQWTVAALARGLHPAHPWYGPVRIAVIVPHRTHAVDWTDRLLKECRFGGDLAHLTGFPYIPKTEIEHITYAHGSAAGKYAGKILLKNGSEIFLALSGDDKSWKTIEGWTFDHLIRDEYAGSENMGATIGRSLLAVRSNAAKVGGGLYLWATTSTDPNEEWEAFRDSCRTGQRPKAAYFEVNPSEAYNYVSKEARDAWAATLSEEQRSIRATGGSTASTSLYIYRRFFDNHKHRLCQHLDYQPGPTDNLVVGYDPGISDPCGILMGYISPERPETIIFVKFIHYRHGTRLDHVHHIRDWADGRLITWFVCDPNINKRESNGVRHAVTFFQDLETAKVRVDGDPIMGRNRNVDGIPLVEDYLTEKTPGVTLIFDMAGEGMAAGVEQMRNYRYKQNQDGSISSDTYSSRSVRDEACLVAGTLVDTMRGPIPIERVVAGDLVMTRAGWRPVSRAWQSSPGEPTLVVRFSNGSEIQGTGNHRIFTQERGWIRLDLLRYSDTCVACEPSQTSSFTTAKSTTNTTAKAPAISATDAESCCIAPSGVMRTAISPRTMTSTIGMATSGTMPWKISNASAGRSTPAITAVQSVGLPFLRGSGRCLTIGTGPQRGALGTASSRRPRGLTVAITNTPAISAERPTKPEPYRGPASVLQPVEPSIVSHPGSMISTPYALPAGSHSGKIATSKPSLAPVSVVAITAGGTMPVYDLSVEGEHEFFANGILVHNCHLLKYLCSRRPKWIDRGVQRRTGVAESSPEQLQADADRAEYERQFDEFVGPQNVGGTTFQFISL